MVYGSGNSGSGSSAPGSGSNLDEAKQRILRRVDLAALIGESVKLTTRSGRAVGLCPFHADKNPSFTIYNDHYYCFGCKANGDAIDFVRKTSGLGFIDALRHLATKYGVDAPELQESDFRQKQRGEEAQLGRIMAAAQDFFVSQLKSPRGAEARQYLERRGFTPERIAEYGFGLTPEEPWGLSRELRRLGFRDEDIKSCSLASTSEKTGKLYDFFRDNRVMIPIRDPQGRVIAFGGRTLGTHPAKYINSRETRLFDKSATLFGYDKARLAMREKRRAIVVEGYMDVLQLWANGFNEAVACMGTALSVHHLRLIRQACGSAILLFDGDAAGQNASLTTVQNALEVPEVRVLVATLPRGEDPDTFVTSSAAERGKDALENLVQNSRELLDFAIAATLKNAPATAIPEICSRELFPWLARISDRVQQSFLMSRVAQISGINARDIEREIRSLAAGRTGASKVPTVTTGKLTREAAPAGPAILGQLEAELIGHLYFANPGEIDVGAIAKFAAAELNLDPVWSDLVSVLIRYLSEGKAPASIDLSASSALQAPEVQRGIDKLKEKSGAYACADRRLHIRRIMATFQKRGLQTTIAAMKSQLAGAAMQEGGAQEVTVILREIGELNKRLMAIDQILSAAPSATIQTTPSV